MERVYSTGAYPAWQWLATSASNLSGLAGLDVLVVAVAGWAIAHVVGAWRRWAPRRRGRVLAHLGLQFLLCAALLACWFMVSWGLNYRRTPLSARLQFDGARVTPARVRELADAAVGALNAAHGPAHAQPWPSDRALSARLAPAFSVALDALGLPKRIVPGRPKTTLLGPYFRAAGIAGFTNPFLLEVMMTPDALPFEQPGLLAHEWAHLAGLTNEAEAGFLGWVTCVRGDDQARYSGWLDVFPRLIAALPPAERKRLVSSLSEGVRADYRAIDERLRRVRPLVRDIAWSGYDQFLKANRVAEGVQSYDEVTRLMAGTSFDAGWRPRVR